MNRASLPEIESSAVLESVVTPAAVVEEQCDVTPGSGSFGAFFFVVDQCIVSATAFLTTAALGRTCSRDELGKYYLAFSILLFARNIQAQLVTDPYKIYWSRQPRSSRGAYLGSTLVQHSVLTIVTMLALLAYITLLHCGTGPRALLPVTWMLFAGLPVLMFRDFIRNVALSHLRAFAAIAIDSTVAVLQISLLLILAHLHHLTSATAYVAMGGASLAACVGWFGCRNQRIQFVRSQMTPHWKRNWSFGKWALANHLLGELLTYASPWLVAIACGASETGMLAAAMTIVGLSYPFVSGLGNFLGPRAAIEFSRGRPEALVRLLTRFAVGFALTLGAFCVAIAVFGNSLAVLVYGDRYQGLGTIITVLSITVLVKSLRMTAGIGLWAIEQPWANPVAEVGTIVVTIAVALLCMGHFGLLAFVASMLSGTVAGMMIATFALIRLLKPLRAECATDCRSIR